MKSNLWSSVRINITFRGVIPFILLSAGRLSLFWLEEERATRKDIARVSVVFI